MKTSDDRNFTLDINVYPLKAFVPKEIYIGKLSKVFRHARREKNVGLSLNMNEKNKKWRENKNNHINLKDSSTKADTKSEEAGDSNTVFSDLTFTVAADPYQV